MNLDDFEGLKEAIADTLNRQDLEGQIPVWIAMAEAFCDRSLRTREMIRRSRTLAEGRYIALPGDWRKAKNIQNVDSNCALGLMAYDEIDKYRADLNGEEREDDPRFYALVGETMELAPSPSPARPIQIEMIYYAKVPRLKLDFDRNWLLNDYPDILLYGALVHSAPYLKDDPRIAVWKQQFEGAVQAANQSDAEARWSGAPMTRRVKGF